MGSSDIGRHPTGAIRHPDGFDCDGYFRNIVGDLYSLGGLAPLPLVRGTGEPASLMAYNLF